MSDWIPYTTTRVDRLKAGDTLIGSPNGEVVILGWVNWVREPQWDQRLYEVCWIENQVQIPFSRVARHFTRPGSSSVVTLVVMP